jgi:N-methylhydantoinase A
VCDLDSARLRSTGIVQKLPQRRIAVGEKVFAKPVTRTDVFESGTKVRTAVYNRDDLMAGMKLRTPCIVTEYSSTTLVPGGANAVLDSYGNLIIQIRSTK